MQSTQTPARSRIVLAVLFTGAFVMGCAEMLVVAMLDLISSDLAVSVPAAGALVTANALGLAIGGPLLTLATTRLDRRRVLLGTLTVFVLGNVRPVLVDDYRLFVAVRVVIGAAQGLFIAAAMVTATSIVPPDRSGRAMAVVISGFATASAVGLRAHRARSRDSPSGSRRSSRPRRHPLTNAVAPPTPRKERS
jgi:MFS transporter, DHA1 family, inner membrane transport protein